MFGRGEGEDEEGEEGGHHDIKKSHNPHLASGEKHNQQNYCEYVSWTSRGGC